MLSGYKIRELCTEAGLKHDTVAEIKIFPDRAEFYHYVEEDDGSFKVEQIPDSIGQEQSILVVERKTLDIDWGLL